MCPKTCSCCGLIHIAIPANAIRFEHGDPMDGIYFNCRCGSTLFLPLEQKAEAA